MCNIAVISVHTSPLARPGTRDSGGLNVYIGELSRELGRRYHRMDIFTRRSDAATPEIVDVDANTRIISVTAGPYDLDKEQVRLYLPEFLRGVIAFQERTAARYDLIHSHYWLSAWVGQALKRRWQTPHVIMFHTLGEAKNRAGAVEPEPAYRIEAEREVARDADRIVCASEGEREVLERLYCVPPERIAVIPCGVDLERFAPLDPAAARSELGLDNGAPIVLFVGRIEPLKGIDMLLQAVARLETRFRLMIVGGDEKDSGRRAGLAALARELEIGERVEFVDAVPHDQLPLYYNAAAVCVIPSHYESFGLVALEAMACGVPVVASDVGGLRDTVRDGQTGYLVPWSCPEPFAERLELLLGNQELRGSLGLLARSAVERFRWSEVAGRVEDIYHELVSRYRGVTVGSHAYEDSAS
ncbi:MAG: glycosyltransferase [Chloroflexi bacterium]|nr:glycosyltransferase [Chloroflexota bacterium]